MSAPAGAGSTSSCLREDWNDEAVNCAERREKSHLKSILPHLCGECPPPTACGHNFNNVRQDNHVFASSCHGDVCKNVYYYCLFFIIYTVACATVLGHPTKTPYIETCRHGSRSNHHRERERRIHVFFFLFKGSWTVTAAD